MQEEVHLGERPGGADGFLPEEGIAARAAAFTHQPPALHEQRGGPTGRIANVVAFLRIDDAGHEFGDLGGGVEFASLFASRGGKAGDQVFVCAADDVESADTRRAQIERRLGKVFEQVTEDIVLLLLVAQLVRVEADVLEDVLELGAVGLFDGMQRLVDTLTVASLEAALVQGIERGALGEDEGLLLHHGFNQLRRVRMLRLVARAVVLPYVRDVFQEQHGEDVVLVDRGVDHAAECVTGAPGGLVDLLLCNGVHLSARGLLGTVFACGESLYNCPARGG